MMKKTILGLDLGTNSIGWALVEIDHKNKIIKIIGLGSRILPMNAKDINDFESKGAIKSTASQRTQKRGPRRINERYLLRRDRLHLVLKIINALPEHYKLEIDFERKGKRCGQFQENKEPKLAYKQNPNNTKKYDFLFKQSYGDMLQDMKLKNSKGQRVPYDWTLYYLQKKALDGKKLTLNELAWVLLSYNQKRGYEKTEVIDKTEKEGELIEELDLKVIKVEPKKDNKGKQFYRINLDGNDKFSYKEYSDKQMTFVGDIKEIVKTSKVDEDGNIKEDETEFTVIDIYTLTINKVDYKLENNKHSFTLIFDNGWKDKNEKTKYTSEYKNAIGKKFDYIIETTYSKNTGEIIKQSAGKKGGLDRKIRKPKFTDDSNDWSLLKKRTEKEALQYNIDNNYINKKTGVAKKYISPIIYNVLKNDAQKGTKTKIVGGMFQVIDRSFYREELNDIIKNQSKFHTSLNDKEIFEECVVTLYPENKKHAKNLLKHKDTLQNLITNDILLYQRPLKSKKSEISNCKYEIRYWEKTGKEVVDKETGEILEEKIPFYHKVASVSHPLFQEFRIWDKIHNLRLIKLEDNEGNINVDVTKDYFKTDEDYEKLFKIFNSKKKITKTIFLDFCKKQFKIKPKDFTWNYPDDEELKGNETRTSFIIRFKRCGFNDFDNFLTQDKEVELWHYIYSVNYKDRTANENKSLKTFFNRYFKNFEIEKNIVSKIINDFANYPKFSSQYCAYSEKSLKKLLPFLRIEYKEFDGKFDLSEIKTDLEKINYNASNINSYINQLNLNKKEKELKKQQLHQALWQHSINQRIDTILEKLSKIDFEADEIDYSDVIEQGDLQKNILAFPKGLFNVFKEHKKSKDFKNLNLTQTSYLVYGRHSELATAKYWKSPKQIREELHKELKQHSLNNPIAEKVILEMMQVVADIWKEFGEKENEEEYKKLFDEIHIEVGRELNKSAKEKLKITANQKENKEQNKRIRQILEEFLQEGKHKPNIKSKDHLDRLKIMEDGARMDKEFFEKEIKGDVTQKEINNILKKPHISKDDFDKYKLWIEQGYRSPYTNQMIKLSDLFDVNKYNIDHIFPQARITNDSLTNKVVCEREVNKKKSNLTGRKFIIEYQNTEINGIKIISEDDYVSNVKKHFSGTKRDILLSKKIPSKFTSKQLNTTRHISRKAMELLSHIVREEGEVEFRSKNVLPVTGSITSKLKREWKLDQVWRELVTPRFKRLNELTESNLFGQEQISKNGVKYFDCNLDQTIREKNESYDIKRIDHRHHALDALIIALCTQEHVNYLNNINANKSSKNYGKQKQIEKYRLTLKKKIMWSEPKKNNPNEKNWYYMLPGEKRINDETDSSRNTVVQMNYISKDKVNNKQNYKQAVLQSLQKTIVTFKQNLRVINKTVNYYKNNPNNKELAVQEPKTLKDVATSKNKYNWVVRRSLGKDTYYGRVNLKLIEEKRLTSSLNKIYDDISIVVDKELKKKLKSILENSADLKDFENKVKEEFFFIDKLKLYYFTDDTKNNKKITSREQLSTSFNSKKIKEITDTGIQKILLNHLKQFDTIGLPFNEAIKYYDATLEKEEFIAIVNDEDNDFTSEQELINYLENNDYKYKKHNFKTLNVFVDKILQDYVKENKLKITEHPEIAFIPEKIIEMNFDSKKITDTIIQKTLLNHSKQFDTIKLPFNEAIKYYDATLEKGEFVALTNNEENDFATKQELINYLENNDYKYKKHNFKTLNVFVDRILQDYVKENKLKITEHPEIAFTPEKIIEMNQPEELKHLNNGKTHAPIKKVRIYSGFNKQRPVSDDKDSVKNKQYIVNDAGSNLYLGIYEREYTNDEGIKVKERKFESIKLINLIEKLKQEPQSRKNPLPNKIFDDNQNEYKRIFTLSPLDLVYVPTDEEIENPSPFDVKNLTVEQCEKVYKLVKYSGNTLDFIPYNISSIIFNTGKDSNEEKIFLKKLEKKSNNNFKLISPKTKKTTYFLNEIGKTSKQDKSQNTIDGKYQIKYRCWKLKTNRLGNIIGVER